MFSQGIRTNIAINLVIILLLAMILVDFVVITTFQRGLLRSEISKGDFFISSIGYYFSKSSESYNGRLGSGYKNILDRMAYASGFSCVLVINRDGRQVYSFESRCSLSDELKSLTRETIETGEKTNRFTGTT